MRVREYGEELLTRLLDQCVAVTPGALGAGLVGAGAASSAGSEATSASPGRHGMRSIAAVGVAATVDDAQVSCGQGPLIEALDKGAVVVVPGDGEPGPGDGDTDATGYHHLDIGRYPALLEQTGPGPWQSVGGVVVMPGEWGDDLPVVLTVYLDAPVRSDGLAELDRWEALLASALAVVEYCEGEETRAEQMLQMIQYRRVVEQAKGLVMSAVGGDAQSAFGVLSRASQHFNIRVRTLAVALVEHVGRGSAEHPDDPSAVVVPGPHERHVAAQVWTAITQAPGGT